MKNTKKILAGIMALTMTAGFAACSGGDDQGSGDGGTAAEAAQIPKLPPLPKQSQLQQLLLR